MAGKKFLNPFLKAILCVIGVAVMGYYLLEAVQQGEALERLNLVRWLVLMGFAYLLYQSVKDLTGAAGR
jgi:hypothetical protein|uniref:Uncharacterized protein n=1 Tax=Desulfomonile tiedjei TaxID=2358 RepID=A0A7C4AT51_9BACT